MKKILIYNKTENKLLNQEFQCYNSFFKRFKGLMLKKNIKEAMIFDTSHSKNKYFSSIHSFFMLKTIDVYFIDKKMKVYEIARLKPWRIYIPKKKAKFILEVKKDSLRKENLDLNDEVVIKTNR